MHQVIGDEEWHGGTMCFSFAERHPLPFGDSVMCTIRKNLLLSMATIVVFLTGCSTQSQTGQLLGLKLGGQMEVSVLENSTLNTATAAPSKTDNQAMLKVSGQPSLQHLPDGNYEELREEDIPPTSWDTRF